MVGDRTCAPFSFVAGGAMEDASAGEEAVGIGRPAGRISVTGEEERHEKTP